MATVFCGHSSLQYCHYNVVYHAIASYSTPTCTADSEITKKTMYCWALLLKALNMASHIGIWSLIHQVFFLLLMENLKVKIGVYCV